MASTISSAISGFSSCGSLAAVIASAQSSGTIFSACINAAAVQHGCLITLSKHSPEDLGSRARWQDERSGISQRLGEEISGYAVCELLQPAAGIHHAHVRAPSRATRLSMPARNPRALDNNRRNGFHQTFSLIGKKTQHALTDQ